MIYKHDYQRMALDTDRMMITQCSSDYHDYSDDKLACIYIKWAEEQWYYSQGSEDHSTGTSCCICIC